MRPVIPHFSSECLEDLNITNSEEWPVIDKKLLIKDKVKIVIQLNGKKRSVIECKKDITEQSLIEIIKNNTLINKFLEKKNITRSIYVKNKLINLIIK